MPSSITYRPIQPTEYPFLSDMLYEAIFVPEGEVPFPKSIIQEPAIQKYVAHWNTQPKDVAIVAVYKEQLIGATWGRLFPNHNKGYGFVDDQTPEISIAIRSAYRRQGIGTALLRQIEVAYSALDVEQLSLSVTHSNPAKTLYERQGYTIHKKEEMADILVKNIRPVVTFNKQ